MNIPDSLKKIGVFFLLALFVVGAGLSIGWLGHVGSWLGIIGELVVVLFAIPEVIKMYKYLIS